MVGLNSNFQNPKENLAKAIIAYDKRAHEVREYFKKRLTDHKEAQDAFDDAMKLWLESKKMLEETPTKENALKIRKNLRNMIKRHLDGTKPLATPDLALISLTGKLCRKPVMLTIDYLLKIWGVNLLNYNEDIAQIIKNFHKNIKNLSKNRLNNEESLALLKKAERQFKFFEFMYKSKSHFIPNLLSKKADDNFLIIRQIKKIYKKEAENDKQFNYFFFSLYQIKYEFKF